MLITGRYRIHINSIDLNGTSHRCCGGIGFAVQEPVIRLQVDAANKNEILTSHGVEGEEFVDLVRNVEKFEPHLRVLEIESERPHIGLGSLTQLKLSVLKAVRLLKNEYMDETSIPSSLRIGATSGIGFGAFLYGGFIIDGGYRVDLNTRNSINGEGIGRPAPIIARHELPKEWGVLLAVPKTLQSISGVDEEEFFASITPIKKSETREIAYSILLGLLPAIREANFAAFLGSLNDICQMGSKPHEIRLNSSCHPIISSLKTIFGFGGLSSLGPTCYTFFEKSRYDAAITRNLELRFPDFSWIATEVCNAPYEVSMNNGLGGGYCLSGAQLLKHALIDPCPSRTELV